MLECVVNLAEGRDESTLAALDAACGASLLDRHTDSDHHRSVFTLAGPGPRDAARAAADLARSAAERIAGWDRDGVHPALGLVDVVPFVALGEDRSVATEAAQAFAAWLAGELGVPSFLYGDADPDGRSLPSVRRDAFTRRPPDYGRPTPHPTIGATSVGARPPLVAVNCWLNRDDLDLARSVAAAVRERDGGLRGVRALGFRLPSLARAQVSLNVTDLAATGVEAACIAVRGRVEAARAAIERVEWVGLVPLAELDRCTADFRAWSDLEPSQTIEARLSARAGR